MHRLALIGGVAVLLLAQAQQPRSATRYDVVEKSIGELGDALRAGTTTSREITSAYLDRIAAFDRRGPAINAVIALNPRALDERASLAREPAAGRIRGPLHGIPILIKDNYDTADLPTTAGAVALRDSRPDRD